MKKLFLHIGTHKTGTTAIQFILNRNREALSNCGWLYPLSGMTERHHGHHELAWTLLGRSAFDFSRLRKEIEDSPCANVVVSSEEFEFCKDAAKVKEAFSFAQVEVVLYLRRQDDLLLSEYNQNVKSGTYFKPLAHFADMLERQSRLDYFGMCNRWSNAFGKDALKVCIYRTSEDALKSFARLTGLPLSALNAPVQRQVNVSMDPRLTGALKILNQLRAGKVDEALLDSMFVIVKKFGEKLGKEKRYSLMKASERAKFMQKYSQSNEKLSSQYLSGDTFDDPLIENADELKVGENLVHPALVKELLLQLARRNA